MEATRLDTRPERALTSREIAKVLCAFFYAIDHEYPEDRKLFEPSLDLVMAVRAMKAGDDATARLREVGARFITLIAPPHPQEAWRGWQVALTGIVSGFDGWCDSEAVLVALQWTRENMEKMFETIPNTPWATA
jgi:hypothetical protein